MAQSMTGSQPQFDSNDANGRKRKRIGDLLDKGRQFVENERFL